MDVARFRQQLTRLSRRLRQEGGNELHRWSQWVVLSAVDRLGENASPTRIAREESLRSSNLATLLKALEQNGLIQRSPDALDRRRVRLALTTSGAARLENTRRQRDAWLGAAIQDRLSTD